MVVGDVDSKAAGASARGMRGLNRDNSPGLLSRNASRNKKLYGRIGHHSKDAIGQWQSHRKTASFPPVRNQKTRIHHLQRGHTKNLTKQPQTNRKHPRKPAWTNDRIILNILKIFDQVLDLTHQIQH